LRWPLPDISNEDPRSLLPDDPASRYISSRRIDPQVASARSFQRAKTWLKSCTQAHEAHVKCPRYTTPILPTRVIDVSSLNPRIVASNGQHGDYVALSYCWGGPQLTATTRRNIESRMKGFRLSTLPRTLRDAMKVTRQLGLRFLWVDSMCILQDSSRDKQAEMAKMCQVYKNSFVTIIAGSSRSCHEGFLEDRLSRHPTLVSASEAIEPEIPSIYNTSALKLPYRCPDGSLGTLSMTKSASLSLIWDEKNEPIYRRAWALQERFLSPRVLLYASDRLVFRCQNTYIMNGATSDGHAMPPELLDSVFFSDSPPPQSEFANGSVYLFKNWSSIVESYAKCELTVAADKLPGLSGLVEQYQRLTGDQYRAGLWLSALPGALVWKSMGEGSRAPGYRAPSWSWASMDGDVQMNQIETTEDIELVDCHVSLKTKHVPFGEVTKGVVILKGRLMETKLGPRKRTRCTVDISWWPRRRPDPDWELYEPDRRHFRSEFPPNEAIGTIKFDTSEDEESDCPLWFLKFYTVPEKIMVGGLALTPVTPRQGCLARRFHLKPKLKSFRRVGTFLMDYFQEDCFQYTGSEVIRII